MASTSSLASVGSVLRHRWRLVQKLGEGSVGEVYAAELAGGGDDPRVAVKVLRPELAANPAVAARFVQEGRECMRLIHPNIARVLECDERDEREDGSGSSPFLVMELLEGVPLGAYTRSGGRVPIVQATSILQGTLAALAFAHAQGVVHRDLKPDNVFLTRQSGGTFVVKVLDFAMAGVMDAAGGMGSRTRAGALLGTPAYMSPEQVAERGAPGARVDARADLFAAGAILYEMLTGRIAFSAPTEYARLAAVRSTDPEPMDRVDPALIALGPFVVRALQKSPEQRFSSALDMARALAAAIPHDPSSQTVAMAETVAMAGMQATDGRVGSPSAPPGTSPLGRSRQVPSLLAVSAASGPVPSALAQTAPTPLAAAPRRAPGGTLASPADEGAVAESARPGVVSGPIGGTLPSKDLPRIVHVKPRGRSMPAVLVAALVALGIALGFLMGWVSAHLP